MTKADIITQYFISIMRNSIITNNVNDLNFKPYLYYYTKHILLFYYVIPLQRVAVCTFRLDT